MSLSKAFLGVNLTDQLNFTVSRLLGPAWPIGRTNPNSRGGGHPHPALVKAFQDPSMLACWLHFPSRPPHRSAGVPPRGAGGPGGRVRGGGGLRGAEGGGAGEPAAGPAPRRRPGGAAGADPAGPAADRPRAEGGAAARSAGPQCIAMGCVRCTLHAAHARCTPSAQRSSEKLRRFTSSTRHGMSRRMQVLLTGQSTLQRRKSPPPPLAEV